MKNKLSILQIIESTCVDGPGFRTSIYGAGCAHQCPGCHNPQSWNIKNGEWLTIDEIMDIIKRNEFDDVTFSGGDPFFQAKGFAELAKRIKKETNKNIWCYTGFTFDFLQRAPIFQPLLSEIDVLIDGRFVKELKDEDLLFRGSSNQRIIDVQESLKLQKTILFDYEPRLKVS